MQELPDLIGFPEPEEFGVPSDAEPLFWIKEMRVLSKMDASSDSLIRSVKFRKGLNVVWSPPTDNEPSADQRLSGHASGKTTPYMKMDRNGDYWFSRNDSEQTRFGPEEHAYAHWIPGESREALQGVLILDNGLTEDIDEDAFNARFGALFNEKDESWEI